MAGRDDFVVARVLQHLGFDGRCLVKGGWGEIDSVSTKIQLQTDDPT